MFRLLNFVALAQHRGKIAADKNGHPNGGQVATHVIDQLFYQWTVFNIE